MVKYATLLTLITIGTIVNAQTSTRTLFLETIETAQAQIITTTTTETTATDFWYKSGLAQLGVVILSSYQQIISSQDIPACNFYPSCSHFAQEALTHAPFPQNVLLISDRLQRCNGLPGKDFYYPFLPDKGRYYDPISNYLPSSKHRN